MTLALPIHEESGTQLLDSGKKIPEDKMDQYCDTIIELVEQGIENAKIASFIDVTQFFKTPPSPMSDEEKRRIKDPDGQFRKYLKMFIESPTQACNVNGQLLLAPAFDPLVLYPQIDPSDVLAFSELLTKALTGVPPSNLEAIAQISIKFPVSPDALKEILETVIKLTVPPSLPSIPIPPIPQIPLPQPPFSVTPALATSMLKIPLSIVSVDSIQQILPGLLPVPTPKGVISAIGGLFIGLTRTAFQVSGLIGPPSPFQNALICFLASYYVGLAGSTLVALAIGTGPSSAAIASATI